MKWQIKLFSSVVPASSRCPVKSIRKLCEEKFHEKTFFGETQSRKRKTEMKLLKTNFEIIAVSVKSDESESKSNSGNA